MRFSLPPLAFALSAAMTLLALAAGSGARADTTFVANITHDQEPPPAGTAPFLTSTGASRPGSFGFASFVLNDAQTTLTMSATIFNIDVTGTQTPDTFDNLSAAHIHASADLTNPPTRPVVWGFFGAPDNDNNPDNLVVTPFASGVGGTFTSVWNQSEGNNTTLTAQLPNILAGRSYINFHTVQFGGGEIRGQLTVAPEPGTLALLGMGLLPLAGAMAQQRQRRRKA